MNKQDTKEYKVNLMLNRMNRNRSIDLFPTFLITLLSGDCRY